MVISKNTPGFSTKSHAYIPPVSARPAPDKAKGQRKLPRHSDEPQMMYKVFVDVRTDKQTVLIG